MDVCEPRGRRGYGHCEREVTVGMAEREKRSGGEVVTSSWWDSLPLLIPWSYIGWAETVPRGKQSRTDTESESRTAEAKQMIRGQNAGQNKTKAKVQTSL